MKVASPLPGLPQMIAYRRLIGRKPERMCQAFCNGFENIGLRISKAGRFEVEDFGSRWPVKTNCGNCV
jgi:hypothetical protein